MEHTFNSLRNNSYAILRKYIVVLGLIFGTLSFQSCSNNDIVTDGIDNDTISAVIEITTSFNPNNNFNRLITITPQIFPSDMIFVFRLSDVVNGNDVWQLLPQTYFLDFGNEVDYNYDFTVNDVSIFMGANFDLTLLSPIWTQNQTFRIVIIPGYFSGKTSKPVDFKDYKAVIKAYNIDESKIKIINE